MFEHLDTTNVLLGTPVRVVEIDQTSLGLAFVAKDEALIEILRCSPPRFCLIIHLSGLFYFW